MRANYLLNGAYFEPRNILATGPLKPASEGQLASRLVLRRISSNGYMINTQVFHHDMTHQSFIWGERYDNFDLAFYNFTKKLYDCTRSYRPTDAYSDIEYDNDYYNDY